MLNTHPKKRSRKLEKALLFLLAIYIMIGTALHFLQEKMMFLPTTLDQDYAFAFKHDFDELFLKPEEGVVINAIHFKIDRPKGVILYFHGNAGDLSRWGLIAEDFVELGYDVLIIDYRGYGKSIGPLSEDGFYRDAQYSYNYLKKFYNEDDILLFGRSLGTGIATYVASKNQPRQLILETPYYSITDVASHRFPIFPVKYLIKYHFPTHAFIQNVTCPITIFHGTSDGVVPFDSAEKLVAVSPKDQTEFVVIEDGDHNNLADFQLYRDRMNAVLNKEAPERSPRLPSVSVNG